MNKFRKYCLIVLPYLVCLISAYVFYILGTKFNSDFKGLLQGIAGTFLSIPIIYLIYELSKIYSQQRLNKELFDYAKMQIDRDVLSIISHLMKATLSYEEISISPKNINTFLSLSKNDLISTLRTNDYLGFQVFKNWEITENNITKIMENSFILQHLDSDQLIVIITLLKEIRTFEFMPEKVQDLYIATGNTTKKYMIKNGANLNSRNKEFPDRYLLLKHLEHNEFIITDFGDFALYQKEKLLQIYKVNDKYLYEFASSFHSLISVINDWVALTGHEFIIDTKMFRLSYSKNK